MTASQTSFLAEITAGHSGPPIPAAKLAYLQQRLRNRMFNFVLEKFVEAQKNGLTKAKLARRIGKKPDVINRWLSSPSNLTSDTICDLLIGIAGEETMLTSAPPMSAVKKNYSHFAELMSNDAASSAPRQHSSRLAELQTQKGPRSLESGGAAKAAIVSSGQQGRHAGVLKAR
jgi:hypothetical protein